MKQCCSQGKRKRGSITDQSQDQEQDRQMVPDPGSVNQGIDKNEIN